VREEAASIVVLLKEEEEEEDSRNGVFVSSLYNLGASWC